MARETAVTLKIGAVVAGSVTSVFGGLKRQVGGLKTAIGGLQTQQKSLQATITSGLGQKAGSTLIKLKRQYEDVGRTIDSLRSKQVKLQMQMERGAQLRTQRGELKGEIVDTAGTAAAIGAPLMKAFAASMHFGAQLRDTAMTGELSRADEKRLGNLIRSAAVTYGQDVNEVGAGTNQLVREGLGAQAEQYVNSLSKIGTALNTSMHELAKGVFTLDNTLGIRGEEAQTRAWGMLGVADREGTFEMSDLVPAMRQLAPSFAQMGVKGEQAIKEIGASLEVGAKGAGTPEEALTNMRNWLSHMTSQQMTAAYAKAGVDYQASMKNLVSAGYSQYEGSLKIAETYIKNAGGSDFTATYATAMEDAQKTGDKSQLDALMERFRGSEIITDMQTMNHLVSMIQFGDDYRKIKSQMDQEGSGYVDRQFTQRADTDEFRVNQVKASVSDAAITLGQALAPAAQEAMLTLRPLIGQFKTFVDENPALVRSVTKLALGFLGLKAGGLGLRWLGNFFIATPWNTVSTLITGTSARLLLLKTIIGSGSGRMIALLQLFGASAKQAATVAPLLGRVAGTAGRLGAVLGGGLLKGLRLAGTAITVLGRALLLNPIGLAITAIALGAYLLYRYWTPISAFFKGLWTKVKDAFSEGIGIIGSMITGWGPLELFYQALRPVFRWFGIELPENFSRFGSQIIDGLVAGIKAKFTAVKDTVTGLGQGLSDWFKDKLDIHSPSRVFQAHGGNVVDGAIVGITQRQSSLRNAALGMAASTAVALGAPTIAPPSAAAYAGLSSTSGGDTYQITFSPHIVVQGGAGEDIEQRIQRALRQAADDFERRLHQVQARQRRRSFADEGGQ